MSKRMKVLVSVLVAVVLLTVGGVATVMADDGSTATDNETGRNCLQAMVAKNLGVTDEELANAFKLARQEMCEADFIRYLDKALAEERITEDEYNAIIAWWEVRPEAVDSLFPCSFGASALGDRHMWGAHINPAIVGKHMWGGYKGWHGMRLPKLAD
ncbi:hypothetical protein ACFLUD_00900 [Chloroflexota bacterium]